MFTIHVIPPAEMRYVTVGDWQHVNGTLIVTVADTGRVLTYKRFPSIRPFTTFDRLIAFESTADSVYHGMTAERIPLFVRQHLVEGKLVEEWVFARNPLPNP